MNIEIRVAAVGGVAVARVSTGDWLKLGLARVEPILGLVRLDVGLLAVAAVLVNLLIVELVIEGEALVSLLIVSLEDMGAAVVSLLIVVLVDTGPARSGLLIVMPVNVAAEAQGRKQLKAVGAPIIWVAAREAFAVSLSWGQMSVA